MKLTGLIVGFTARIVHIMIVSAVFFLFRDGRLKRAEDPEDR